MGQPFSRRVAHEHTRGSQQRWNSSPATQETKGPDAATCRHPHPRASTQPWDTLNRWCQVAKIEAYLFVFRLCIEPLLWFSSTRICDASFNYERTDVPSELHTLVLCLSRMPCTCGWRSGMIRPSDLKRTDATHEQNMTGRESRALRAHALPRTRLR